MKRHYPHTTRTGKDLAEDFARLELQFDRALKEFNAVRYQLKDDWRKPEMLEALRLLSGDLHGIIRRLDELDYFKKCYDYWHKDDVPEIHGWKEERK